MTKTTMKNESGDNVILKESTAGIFRKLTELGNGQHYTVRSQLIQTYKEYWCIGNGSDEFLTLSSDDLLEYREILIKPIDPSDPTKFNWEGIPRKERTRTASTTSSSTVTTISGTTTASSTVTPISSTTTASSTTPIHSSIWTKFLPNKLLGCFSKQRPPGTVIATTTTTTTTSPATTNSATTPPATAAPPPAATTTATTTTVTMITAPATVTPGHNV